MAFDLNSEESQIVNAKIAEQLERYEDMAEHMKTAAQLKKENRKENAEVFTPEERNLFSVAYKNVIGSKRSSFRQAAAIESKSEADSLESTIVRKKKADILAELTKICDEVLRVIKDNLLIDENSDETKVFYLKMMGDYCRYIAEAVDPNSENSEEYIKKANENYTKAEESAKDLESTNPIRLGLALNYSVFYYEIKRNPEEACQLAKKAFDDAMGDLEKLKEDSYKDSTLIMQLLRDNLTLWTNDIAADADAGEDEEK